MLDLFSCKRDELDLLNLEYYRLLYREMFKIKYISA